MQPNDFVLLSLPRSGTHMLRTALNAHPHVWCCHEVFNRDVYGKLKRRGVGVGGRDAPWDGEPVAVYFHRLQRVGQDRFGVCVQPHHFQKRRAGFEEMLAMELPTILLYRLNTLRQYVSRLQARARGKWEAYQGDPPPQPIKVAVEHAAYEQFHYEQREAVATLAARCPRLIALTYEELIADWAGGMRRVFAGIGVAPCKVAPQTIKVGAGFLENAVDNWAEVVKWAQPGEKI